MIKHGVLFYDLLILFILLSSSSYSFNLISATPLIHNPLVSSSSSSSADVQENNVDHRKITNGRLLAGEGQNVVSVDKHGFGGGHGASRGSSGGGHGGGGRYGPRTMGAIPIYAAGAANNNRYRHHGNAATSSNNRQIGLISLSSCLIFAILTVL